MKDHKVYAPIVIGTLCRYEHFKRCVESLSRCTHADKTELVIGLDYPLNDNHQDGYEKIRNYLTQGIVGFKSVIIFERESNFGAVKNFAFLREYVFKNYDCCISSEDDNEFSPNFLDYINWGLETYKNDESVLAICGFKRVNITHYQNNIYKMPNVFNAWGYAIWRDRMQLFEDAKDHTLMKSKLDGYPWSTIFSKNVIIASKYMDMIAKNEFLGDCLPSLFPNPQMYCLFPTISKVRNWGHDGSGLHGGNKKSYEYYTLLPIDTEKEFIPVIKEELYQKRFEKIYKKYYKTNKLYRMWCSFQFIFYKLTGRILIYYNV